MEATNAIIIVLTLIIVSIAIFLALREFNCWYWKINTRIKQQEDTNLLLRKLVEQTELKTVSPKVDKLEVISERNNESDAKVNEEMLKKYGPKG